MFSRIVIFEFKGPELKLENISTLSKGTRTFFPLLILESIAYKHFKKHYILLHILIPMICGMRHV